MGQQRMRIEQQAWQQPLDLMPSILRENFRKQDLTIVSDLAQKLPNDRYGLKQPFSIQEQSLLPFPAWVG
jgi:hypothetical protein